MESSSSKVRAVSPSSFKIIFSLWVLLPFVLILAQAQWSGGWHIDWPDWEAALTHMGQQWIGTVGIAVVGGLLLFFSVQASPDWVRRQASLLLLPFLLPSLLTIIAYMAWFPSMPLGNLSVSFLQGVILSGYVGFNLHQFYQSQLKGLESPALVMGASAWVYWKYQAPALGRGLGGQLPNLSVFALTSFSIPFMLGGYQGYNMEVLLFEKLMWYQDKNQALLIGLFQSLFLGVLFFLAQKNGQGVRGIVINRAHLATSSRLPNPFISKIWAWFFLGYLAFFLRFIVDSLLKGVLLLTRQPSAVWQELLVATQNSLALYGLAFLLAIIGLFLILSWVLYYNGVELVPFWISPTTALTAFAFLLITPADYYLALLLVFVFLYFPTLLRMFLLAELPQLVNQVQIAKLMGANFFLVTKRIIYPQIFYPLRFLASVFAFWVVMDFAVIRFFTTQPYLYLGSLMQSWIAAYRYYEALGVLFFIILFGLSVIGWTYVKSGLFKRT